MKTLGSKHRHAALLIAIYAIAAVMSFGGWLFRRWDAHHNSWVERVFGVLNVPVAHSLISVSVLVLITTALMGRKRFGLIVVATFQILGAYVALITDYAHGLATHAPTWTFQAGGSHIQDILSAVIGAFVLAWLWWMREEFPAKLRPGSWRAAILVSLGGLLVTLVVTWALIWATTPGAFSSHERPVLATLGRSLGDADFLDETSLYNIPGWIPQLASVLVSLTLLAAVWTFLRSGRHETAWSPQRELDIRRLIAAENDPDSLDYFATRRDKSSIFSERGGAALAYRVLHGVSLASGDPVGDPHQWSDVIRRWKAEARRYGWVPAVLGASERGARAYASEGLIPLSIGDEAILYPDHFTLDSPAMTPVRHAVKRARRRGLEVTFRRQDEIEPTELAELEEAAEKWRGNEPERGFSMALNRSADPADFDVLVATARDADGTLMAVLSLVPWGRAGRSLDLMRRNPDAPNGTVELIVTELLQQADQLGFRELSLNFCMFRSVYADAQRLGAGTLTRLNYSLLGKLDALWQLERIYTANQKYEPEWRPRYLCHDSRISLPLVGIAAGVAEGFLPHLFAKDPGSPRLSDAQVAEARRISTTITAPPGPRRGDQQRVRLAHVEYLRAAGREPWPDAAPPPANGADVLTGRVRRIRDHGGVVFVDVLTEENGVAEVRQALLESAVTEADNREFARLIDSGDLIRFIGRDGFSKNGEPSLLVESWELLAKSLHPVQLSSHRAARAEVADGWDGAELTRVERLRHRSAVLRAVRDTLQSEGYLEVETPMLNSVHGGATARPFRTHSSAYGTDLTLRIAPELYLKRLVVAGMGPVFELGRNFRNEGADNTHNPEFTSLEVYQPGGDYTTMRLLAERIIRAAARAVHGREVLPLIDADGERRLIDISGEWPVIPMLDAISEAIGERLDLTSDFDRVLGLAREEQLRPRGDAGIGTLLEGLYGKVVEPRTVVPTFYTDFPQETSPLTRAHRSKPGLVERWDLVVGGMELGTAYSELTDPLDQRDRLVQQSLKAAAGDVEAMEVDERFLHDLELGMPPTGGLGIGIDRLVMLVTGLSIRSVLAFPFTRPKNG